MTTFKYILTLISAASILLLGSCSHERNEEGAASGGAFSVSFTIDSMQKLAATRASATPVAGETTVNSLHLYFFNTSNNLLAEVVSLDSELTMETTYVVNSSLNTGQSYIVYGIANLGSYIDGDAEAWNAQWTGMALDDFKQQAFVQLEGIESTVDYTTQQIKPNALLMSGSLTYTGGKAIQMVLTRNVSRFEVSLSTGILAYELTTVSIWNAFERSSLTGGMNMDYNDASTDRTVRFYGLQCTGTHEQIGGLYAFPNQTGASTINDKTSTCLIVGLNGPSGVRYYRANLCNEGTAQNLRANYSYRVSIIAVTGEGYATEEEAYEGTKNMLLYAVNNWNLDDNGLIVTDEYSLLAVPVKTVQIGASGGESSYTITTYSTLENPAPLKIKSQLWDPDGGKITAGIRDAQLVISAESMSLNEAKRSGVITISYAGLETTVSVIQSAEAGKHLYVTVDDEWTDELPPTANAMSEYVNVDASGPWTATIYGSDNFSFMVGSYFINTITSADVLNSRFHIYTQAANVSKTETLKGFALISLDEDPDNYVAVVTIYQSSAGGIDVNVDALPFYGSKYIVDASTIGSLTYIDNYSFTISSAGIISASSIRLVGTNADKFTVTSTVSALPDGSGGTEAALVVKAKGVNASTIDYSATLVASDNKNGYLSIPVTQKAIVCTPTITGGLPVSTKGGTFNVSVTSNDPYVSWAVDGEIASATSGKTLYNHSLTIPGAGTYTTNANTTITVPKVYYPNRDIDIKGSISVVANLGGITATTEFTQTTLTAKPLKIWSRWGNGDVYTYGSLGNYSYFDGFINRLSAKINGGLNPVLTMLNSDVADTTLNNSHIWAQMSNSNTGTNLTNLWSHFNTWYNNPEFDGIAVMMMGENNDQFSNAAVYSKGYTHDGIARPSGSVILNSSTSSTRIYDFIINRGAVSLTASNITFHNDAVNTRLSTCPTNAVPILSYVQGGYCMVIDPQNKIVYMGDETMFSESTPGTTYMDATAQGINSLTDRSAFINNLIDYMLLAARYGSHFTDLLRDDLTLPAPWDASWGTNAWPN